MIVTVSCFWNSEKKTKKRQKGTVIKINYNKNNRLKWQKKVNIRK